MASRSSSPARNNLAIGVTLFLLIIIQVCSGAQYHGKLIGKLSELDHGLSGEVYAVDARTLFIKDLTYDGEGPAAYFYAGNSKAPIINGFRIRDEQGMSGPLHAYRKKSITLTLPEGKTLNNIRWFAVWCDDFSVNFGDVRIPRGFDYPKPQKLAGLSGVHGVSSEPIVVVDAQTLLIPNFSYDGEAPDAKFWVGAGPHPSSQGIRVPDENGKEIPLRRYDKKTIVLTLPGDLTIHQLGHFGVWCEAFTVDFGHVQIPRALNVPPSLKMLGVSPQSKLNCEVLEDKLAFEVRWAVAGDSIVVQLVGKLDSGQYMSFGLSGNPERSIMVGSDVVVAWVDKQTLQGYAVDYFLDAKSQCSGGRGSCPDTRIQDNTNSIRLLNAAMVNGYSIVTYQRPLSASDELDRQIRTNGSQAIIWAIGPLNERKEVSFHSHYLKTDRFIEFGRAPMWNCPLPDSEHQSSGDNANKESNKQELVAPTTRRPPATPAPASTNGAWEIPPIQCNEPDDGVFYAQMGPTGGKHGYPAITGHVGWGISWYINGLLIPEINVVRGRTYTFVVEAGDDPETPAIYHPFYITDDPIGGYAHKTPEEKAKVKIFAGVQRQRGMIVPTGLGRSCRWTHDQDQPDADQYSSFGAFQRTLSLKCNPGEPGFVQWTPDKNTPDTVYYQCFTHRYLGWKINVLDSCDIEEEGASENHEVYARPEDLGDIESASSIRVSSKVTPASDFYQAPQDYDRRPIDYISMTYQMTPQKPLPPPSLPSSQSQQYIYTKSPAVGPQIMIVRRSNKRPSSTAPRLMERKKTVYRSNNKNSQTAKAKGKFVSSSDSRNTDILKPAKNTGFNPDSIVIEGGFKPIIRSLDSNDQLYDNKYEWAHSKISSNQQLSSKVHNDRELNNMRNYMTIKSQSSKVKQRVGDNDDMEMAADSSGSVYHYLPPSNARLNGAIPNNKRADDQSSDTLIAFDGKKVKDSSLARSIPSRIGDDRLALLTPSGKLSDILTRTPQFAKFRGELPPPLISGEVIRSENIPHTATTKLTAKRTKRSSNQNYDNAHNNNNSDSYSNNNDNNNNNNNNDNVSPHDHSMLASAGQMLITNMHYVFLTIVLYFVL